MRQENGAELFGPNDPRNSAVGIIHIAPTDDRQSILTAILTQDKLKRKYTVLVVADDNGAFRRTTDFAYLRNLLRGLSTQLVIVSSSDTAVTRFAQRQQFPVFRSLENYATYAKTSMSKDVPPVEEESVPSDPSIDNIADPPTQPLEEKTPEVAVVSVDDSERDITPLPALQVRPVIIDEMARSASPMNVHELPDSPRPHAKPEKLKPRQMLFLALLLALFVLIVGTVLSVFAGIGPLATLFPGSAAKVTITPDKKTFKNVYAISAIPWVPDPAQHQVAAHFISVTTPSHNKTVQTGGRGIVQATFSEGTLIFYNALPFEQKVPGGTIFVDTKGVQIITEGSVVIPPANPPTEGSATASAHALVAGAQGNIPANDFKEATCCHSGITFTNKEAFSGGQDERPYSYVQQNDIDTAAADLAAQLTSDGQKAAQAKVQIGEQVAGDIRCTTSTGANHSAGERSSSVTVTVSATCIAEVFNRNDAYTMAANLLKSDATQAFHTNYAQASQVSTTLFNAVVQNSQGTISLRVEAQGVWIAQFDQARQQELARLIAGTSASTAQDVLQHQTGIMLANIVVSDSPGNVLPLDPHKIEIQIQ